MLGLIIILIALSNVYGEPNTETKNFGNIVSYKVTPKSEKMFRGSYYANKKEEMAKKFLLQYNSMNPVVLLIDSIEESHHDAYDFIKSVYKIQPRTVNINFMLMKFNTSGASFILETTKNNRVRFEKLLKEPMAEDPSSFLGRESQNNSAVFFGILNAVHLLPPASGVVVFMKRRAEDDDLVRITLDNVTKKRIRVFVVWGGTIEEKLLKELAIHSGGAFLIKPYKDLSKVYYEQFLESIGVLASVSTILSRKNLLGEYNLNFPVDSYVTGIHISITQRITTGILTTPRGDKIDVLDGDEVAQYSVGSFVKRDDGIHEVHLNTTTPTSRDVGLWGFSVANMRASYNITIFAHTKLTTNAIVTVQNLTTDVHNKYRYRKKIMKLGINGDISSISNISFVDKDGNPIENNVRYTFDKDWENYLMENISNIKLNQKNELNIGVEELPDGPFYAVVNGKDSLGNDFRRLTYVRGDVDKNIYNLPPLTVDVGLGSELITRPFRQAQIFFEVTNNGNTPTLVRFFCKDEQSILLSMNPWFKWINPQETATVRLTLTTKPGFYKDFITFTAAGSDRITKNAIVDVGFNNHDRRDPELDYMFTSDCLGVLLGACEDGTWTVQVKAKDTGSGLSQIISKPKGIYFPNGFTAGTTEEVTGFYSESCCNPDLQLIAFDRENNRKIRNLNAYRATLGPGAIAAIVLGIILLIINIIVIIHCLLKKYKCCKCCKCLGRQEIYELPTYRGPRRS